jgi:flavin reductase (DIM6/NTAB) family NADH-FMN oxidoreductase RutF
VPLLEGAVAHFVVEVMDLHPAGDHTLYIGRVVHFESREDTPLVFYARGIGNCALRRSGLRCGRPKTNSRCFRSAISILRSP